MFKVTFLTLIAVASAAPAMSQHNGSLAHACNSEPLDKIITLAKAANAIFSLGVNDENSSRRLRRHHQGAEMHQHVDRFMSKMHHQLTQITADLAQIGPLSKDALQVERAIRFMAEIIEDNFSTKAPAQAAKQVVNVDMVEERALLSLKRITETFMVISAQCNSY